ncbi:hypothetical protein [Portibacter marinus]|uniref:hypothetical protein n=1 Tax=Portibacter marinus TaxID=2898660 RepID=UPI001F226A09|nr:hypothetical protein [Portibacter marinus]
MVWKVLFFILRTLFLITLPFIVLVRGAVYFNTAQDLGIWPSLAGGIIVTAFLLFIYMTFIYGRFTGRIGDKDNLKRRLVFAFIIVIGFAAHAVIFISNDNIKAPEIKEEYSELHPLLRLAVGVIVKLDMDLVITDGQRAREDYEKMGLKSRKNSLHYKQEDGYTYAIDLRTNDRTEWRNQALAIYFGAMGFNVLRHVGTADHLHISLPCKFHPGAI